MSREKQIEKMARKMCRNYQPNGNCVADYDPCDLECVYGYCAERIYCAGYRKQSEGEWVLLEECANEGVYCSVCHKKVYRKEYANQKVMSPYCPNCGAKMKGV